LNLALLSLLQSADDWIAHEALMDAVEFELGKSALPSEAYSFMPSPLEPTPDNFKEVMETLLAAEKEKVCAASRPRQTVAVASPSRFNRDPTIAVAISDPWSLPRCARVVPS
jgi:hypothetical protein